MLQFKSFPKTQLLTLVLLSVGRKTIINILAYTGVLRSNFTPAIGSVVFCDLGLSVQHSGIYVGNGQIVHLDGQGRILKTDAKTFCRRLHGLNPACIVYGQIAPDGTPLGNQAVADRALSQVGKHLNYNLFTNNCHNFTARCLLGQNNPNCNNFHRLFALLKSHYGPSFWLATNLYNAC